MNEQQIEVVRLEIAKLNLGKDDYLVVKLPGGVSVEYIDGFSHYIKKVAPELATKIIVMVDGIETYIVHRENPFHREDRDG